MTTYGFYSEQQAKEHGVLECSTKDGKIIQVTQISDGEEFLNHYPDTIMVGEISGLIRKKYL